MLSFLFVDRIFHENGFHLHHLFSTLVILNLFARMAVLCYYPSGDVSEDIPCNSTAEVSACCTRGWTCLTNGVCQDDNNPAEVSWARHSCTDRNFFAPECPRFCQSGMRKSLSPCLASAVTAMTSQCSRRSHQERKYTIALAPNGAVILIWKGMAVVQTKGICWT